MKLLTLSEISDQIKENIKTQLDIEIIDFYKNNLGNHDIIGDLLREFDPEILVLSSHKFSADKYSCGKSLKMIICTRGNPINVDMEEGKKRGVIITYTPARNANAVAEFTIGLIISMMRYIPQSYHSLKMREATLSSGITKQASSKDIVWLHPQIPNQYLPYLRFRGSEIIEKNLGLIGFGAIGKLTAVKAKALGMNVSVYDPFLMDESLAEMGIMKLTLADLLTWSDVISLHAKETESSKKIIDTAELKRMKRNAVLINTSRGSLINNEALIKALKEGWIRGAALDVFQYEPLFEDDPILELDNLLFTPHIGGASEDVVKHHSRMLFESITDFINGVKDIRYTT